MAKTNYSPTFPMFPGDAFTITPSDTANLANVAIVYVGNAGGTGNIKVTTAQGTVVIFKSLLAGTVLPVQVQKVWSTDTDVSDLVGIY